MSRFEPSFPCPVRCHPLHPGEQPQDQQYIKLNTNESPYLPSPRVVAAVSEAEVEKLRLYSDPACAQLLRTAAAHFGLQPSQVMPGNGSDENLFFALRAFCDEITRWPMPTSPTAATACGAVCCTSPPISSP